MAQLVLAEFGPVLESASDACGLERAAEESFQFIWRSLRRLGVRPDHAVDDAVQQVFEIAAKKRGQIEAGRERAFLFKTALLVAADFRRKRARCREVCDDEALLVAIEPALPPDELLEQRRSRALLDLVLDELPVELRTVFVLFELERLATADIAGLLALPVGTVASRLRRAREAFHLGSQRLRARMARGGTL